MRIKLGQIYNFDPLKTIFKIFFWFRNLILYNVLVINNY